ncbi:hypothetical protein FB451DRAFT_1398552 [Mycena latifolia]|nr:hypothetical protein FB451DRAFT_1398552 [Mycena latifolia]
MPPAASKFFQVTQVGFSIASSSRFKASEELHSSPSGDGDCCATGGHSHVPGICMEGSFIFMQLWALGRVADWAYLQSQDPSFPYVSASAVPLTGKTEIQEYVALYAVAAANAIEAGCDGVEIHEMAMADPLPTFSYIISQLAARHSKLAEARIDGDTTREDVSVYESNDALRALWALRPLVRAGGLTRADALAAESGDLIAFGRLYIANLRAFPRREPPIYLFR